jgi:hypothetical protein
MPKRKRTAPRKPPEASKEVEELLKSFKCNEHRPLTRFQTISVPYQAVRINEGVYGAAQQRQIEDCSKALGILNHLVTVYMNYKVERDPAFSHLVKRPYVKQLFNAFAGKVQRAQSRIRDKDGELVPNTVGRPVEQDEHLRDYLSLFFAGDQHASLRNGEKLVHCEVSGVRVFFSMVPGDQTDNDQ